MLGPVPPGMWPPPGPMAGGPGGPGPPGNNNRRPWPPPPWVPGGDTKFKQWLWQLEAWQRITSTPPDEQGLQVALSVGGKAKRVATQISTAILARQDGLGILIYVLEALFAAEESELGEDVVETWERFSRARGQSMPENNQFPADARALAQGESDAGS